MAPPRHADKQRGSTFEVFRPMNLTAAKALREITRRCLHSPRYINGLSDIAFGAPSSDGTASDSAEDDLEGGASSKPAEFQDGLKLCKKGEFKKAAEVLTEDLRRYAALADLLAMASRCESSLGRPGEAADLAAAGLTIDPENDHAWFAAIQSLHKGGKAREARSGYKLAPDRAKARLGAIGVSAGYRPDPGLAFLSFQTRDPQDLASKAIQYEINQTEGCLRNFARWQWRKREFTAALDAYMKLIKLSMGSVVPLLMIRSFCHQQLNNHAFAAMDISTALALDPGGDYQTRMEILDARERILKAMALHSAANRTVAFRESYATRHRKEWHQKKDLKEGEGEGLDTDEGGDAPGRKTTEDKFDESMEDSTPSSTVEDFIRMDTLLQGMPLARQELVIDTRVPRFHDEYEAGPHLEHSNHAKCMQWLILAYGESTFSPKRLNPYKARGGDGAEKRDILHRVPTQAPECLEWWEDARIGDVRYPAPKRSYADDIMHSFSNVPRVSMELQFGKTHVAMGYVDLGILLLAKYVGDESSGPVKFVGYEMSPYATAKTHVLCQMLKDQASIESILQVWYSAGWSRVALDEFRQAAEHVIQAHELLPASVKDFIQYWAAAPEVDLKDAQEIWLDLHNMHGCLPANVMDKNDRLEFVKYMLSGRLLDCSVGSTVMFANPPDYPHIARNEYAFWTIDEMDLGQHHQSCGSIMSVVTRLLQARIKTLRRHVASGRVEIDLRLKAVHPHDTNVHKEIRDLVPWSVSWSNLCDYVTPVEFHAMAKACSAPRETIHHLYSMNWIREVKGTFLVDYPSLQAKLDMVEACKERITSTISRACGRDIIRTPPVSNPFNLAYATKEDFYQKWLEKFMAADGLDGTYIGSHHAEPFSLFAGGPGVVHFSITYDPIMATRGWMGSRNDRSLSASLSRLARK